MPGNVPVASGTVELRPEIAAVHFPEKTRKVEQVEFASLIKASPKRTAEVIEFERPNIRQQIAAANSEPDEAVEERSGLFRRVFGRG